MNKIENVNYLHSEEFHNENAANEILPFFFELYKPKSIIDFGCGTGSWLSAAKKLEIEEVKGVDGIKVEKDLLKIQDDEFILHDLKTPLNLNRKYDLAISLEVVEHLPETVSNTIIDTITQHADVVLFSAAIPYQTGDHHINEQWPAYWQDLFSKRGFLPFDILRSFFWENENVDWWYSQNILVYAKASYMDKLGQPNKIVLPLVHPKMASMKEETIIWQNHIIENLQLKNRLRNFLKKLTNNF